jgi:hypothetical protein
MSNFQNLIQVQQVLELAQEAQSFQKDPYTSGINKQIEHIVKSAAQYARPTRFFFEFTRLGIEENKRLVRSCQNLSIPGRALLTQPNKIYGPPKEYLYESNYQNEIQLTFRVSVDMFERDLFENWMNASYSPTTADLVYPDDYKTTLKIYQLDRSDTKIYCSELYDVFCKNISDIELGTDLSDQIETVTITMSYSEYRIIGKLETVDLIGKERQVQASNQAIAATIASERSRSRLANSVTPFRLTDFPTENNYPRLYDF